MLALSLYNAGKWLLNLLNGVAMLFIAQCRNIGLLAIPPDRQGVRFMKTKVHPWIYWMSGWLSFNGLSQTADIKVHVIHTSRVIITYTLESLFSLTQNMVQWNLCNETREVLLKHKFHYLPGSVNKIMFILPFMEDHLSWKTTKFSGCFIQVPIYTGCN